MGERAGGEEDEVEKLHGGSGRWMMVDDVELDVLDDCGKQRKDEDSGQTQKKVQGCEGEMEKALRH